VTNEPADPPAGSSGSHDWVGVRRTGSPLAALRSERTTGLLATCTERNAASGGHPPPAPLHYRLSVPHLSPTDR